MVKGRDEVVSGFNATVNMTLEELQDWMANPRSEDAGLGPGQESGRKIIGILKSNPSKDPSKYRDEDIDHMRRVAAYNKRHLAQEGHMKQTKTPEELEKAKSTISLRNWGHDPLKNMKGAKPTLKASGGGNKKAEGKADAGEAEPKDEAPKKRARAKKDEGDKPKKEPRTGTRKSARGAAAAKK